MIYGSVETAGDKVSMVYMGDCTSRLMIKLFIRRGVTYPYWFASDFTESCSIESARIDAESIIMSGLSDIYTMTQRVRAKRRSSLRRMPNNIYYTMFLETDEGTKKYKGKLELNPFGIN